MGEGGPELLRGHSDFPQNKLHLRKIGAAAKLRTSQASHCVTEVADFAEEIPRRPSQEKMARMMPQCAASTLGQLTLPGVAFSKSSGDKWRLAASNTSHSCTAVPMKNLVGPDNVYARVIVRKIACEWGPHLSFEV